ncbi:MAG: rhomboid family intramembrane serine protease [Bacteroidales bacterium]|nr:rhomboid family intramembrane serine protease [Bacteroidales bacterium]
MSFSYSTRSGGFLSGMPPVTRFIFVINIVLFILDYLTYPFLFNRLALFPYGTPYFEPYQLISHMFMHGGFWHIFLNMFGLFMFGKVLENVLGSQRFFILYFISGLGAAALQLFIFHRQGIMVPMVGASGALMGIVAAFAVLFPNVELMVIPIPVPVKAKYLIPGFMVLSLFMGMANVSFDNIAHFAHLGGAIVGFLIILLWKNKYRRY